MSPTQPPPTLRPPSAAGGRVAELDGLRGWASLCVVCYHLTWQVFGVQVPGTRTIWTAFILDGPLAVAVFFVLSGDALGSATLSSRAPVRLWRLVLKRYVRLSLPICAICLVIGLLKATGCVRNGPAAAIVGQAAYFGGWLPATPTLAQIMAYAFGGVFRVDDATTLDRFLWTMPIEAAGSCCVFATVVCARAMERPSILVLALFEAALSAVTMFGVLATYVACFFAGLYFAMARAEGTFAAMRTRRATSPLSGAAIAILVVAESASHLAGRADVTPLLAIPLVFCVLSNEPACRAFRSGPSQWLGRISFSLYLVQFPVLVSATSTAIVVAQGAGRLQTGWVCVIALGSIVLSLAAATLFEPIDRFATWLSRQVAAPRALALPCKKGHPGEKGHRRRGNAAASRVPVSP